MYLCKQNKFQHVDLYDEQDMDKAGRYVAQFENRGISEEKQSESKTGGYGKHSWAN